MKRILLTVCLAGATACASTQGPGSGPASSMATKGTIVDVAASDGRFTTLVAAVQAAGLAEALSGEGPFTVFAPTDDAFKALPAGTVDSLLKPENKDKLVQILQHHVVSGKVTAEMVTGLSEAATLGGTTLGIEAADGAVTVGGSKVIVADVMGSNGVIHVVDKVILPAE